MSEPSFTDQLQEELDAWQRQGVVGPSQARRILAYYGLASQEAEEARREGRLAAIFGILGALLVGIGDILFVASNWQGIDRPYKILMLLAVMGASYGIGYWLKYSRADHPRIGAAFVFLGSLVFGANVFLIAQTYHLRANEPLLLAFWAVGVFPIAYVAVSRPSLYLAILAALAWYGFQLFAWRFYDLGAGGVTGLAAFLPYGLLFMSLGELQRSSRKTQVFSWPFVQLGMVVAFLTLLVFSFADFWRSLASSVGRPRPLGLESVLGQLNISFAVFAVLALLITVVAVWRHGFSRSSLGQGAGVLALGASSLLVVFHPFQEPKLYAISFNLVLFAGIIWAVVMGIWTRREFLINSGLVFFVFLVFARYFDLFFSFVFFSLMDRSLVFIGAGLLLLGGGYLLERYRRRLLREMRKEEPSLGT